MDVLFVLLLIPSLDITFWPSKAPHRVSKTEYFVRKFRHSYLLFRQFIITLIIISFSSGLDSAIMIVSATNA